MCVLVTVTTAHSQHARDNGLITKSGAMRSSISREQIGDLVNHYNIYWLVAAIMITNPVSLLALSVRDAAKDTHSSKGFSRKELAGSHLAVFGVIALATALAAL